ncbi:MAG: CHRD domain-containing protein [Anaerolineales bacterium]|nr:CHRD domain-containing protein [Anaerolineales bacterium]
MKRKTSVFFITLGALVLSFSLVSAAVLNYRAHLSGQYEIPFLVDTQAQGQAFFQVLDDGMGVSYKVNVANLENITMAHIHLLPASGTGNGSIIVWLYPSAPPAVLIPGTTNGTLVEGVFTNANVVLDYNGDSVKDLKDVVEAIEAGDTYVNIHTQANPGGEIHGPVH